MRLVHLIGEAGVLMLVELAGVERQVLVLVGERASLRNLTVT